MRVRIAVEGTTAPQEARSLHDWLLRDPAARRFGAVELEASQSPDPGAMGPLFDVVSLVIGSGLSAGSLAVSVAQWRGTRQDAPQVTVERPDGTRMTITDASPEECARLALLLSPPADPLPPPRAEDEGQDTRP